MSGKQKYYVLENGEYILKYKEPKTETLQTKHLAENGQDKLKSYLFTPKIARDSNHSKQQVQLLSIRNPRSSKKTLEMENSQGDRLSQPQYPTRIKDSDDKPGQIILQLNNRVLVLEEENKGLIYENKHLASKAAFHLEKFTECEQRAFGLQQQIDQLQNSYQHQLTLYKQVCQAYEDLAQQNRELHQNIKDSDNYSPDRPRSHQSSDQASCASEEAARSSRHQHAEDVLYRTQSKVQRYLFDFDLLKQQTADKDLQIGQLVNQLRDSETVINNLRLTEDFLITELQKQKAIVHNHKMLQQALNQKISRISRNLGQREQMLRKVCNNCLSVVQSGSKSLKTLCEFSRTSSEFSLTES